MGLRTHRLAGPGRLEAVTVDDPPGGGTVRVRLAAGAICGSDLAKYRGVPDPRWPHDGEPGFPLHEVVGLLDDGRRVVGMSSEFRGLADAFLADPALLVDAPAALCAVHATMIQPLATVLCSLERAGDVRGASAAVIGLGSIGALFAHVLRVRGAARVLAVDPVDRSDVGAALGVDETVCATARGWLDGGAGPDAFDLVVEAVGHQQQTFTDAVRLTAPGGRLIGFGVPDDAHYAVPMVEMFRKQLTVQLGETTDWRRHLQAATEHVVEHADALAGYVTDVYAFARAGDAFAAAAHPRAGQLKVALEGDAAVDGAPAHPASCPMPPVPRRHGD